MGEVDIFRAGPGDDARLRAFLREGAEGSAACLRLEREPDYFAALQVEGSIVDVIAAQSGRKIVGLATRSEKPCFVDGTPRPVMAGYLSNVKIAPGWRSSALFFRGYRFFRQLHRAGTCRFYLMAVLEDNPKVLRVLRNRAGLALLAADITGLPAVIPLGQYNTRIISAACAADAVCMPGLSVRRARDRDVPRIMEFLHAQGPRRCFFPAYSEQELRAGTGLLRGLCPGDIFLAWEGRSLVGTLAAWDQTGFRKWYVYDRGQSGTLTAFFADTGTRLHPSGSALACRMLALVCVDRDRPEVLRALLQAAKQACAAGTHMPYLLTGLHAQDPLDQVLKREKNYLITSSIYLVYWPEEYRSGADLPRAVPYLELGAL